jgi:hypothetical protein
MRWSFEFMVIAPSAQLVAAAEASGVGRVLSFDRALKRATSIEWREP